MFKSIKIDGWRQYEKVEINFHPQLTIITGANGAGKTTILNIINQHFGGFMPALVGIPRLDSGILSYLPGLWGTIKFSSISPNPSIPNYTPPQMFSIGTIEYSNGATSQINIPQSIGSTYHFNFSAQQQVKGMGISSHRPIFKYEPVTNIPTNVTNKAQSYNNYRNSFINRYNGGASNNRSETFHIKETIISLGAFGPGNQIIQRNEGAVRIFSGFEEVLKKVLPNTLGFQSISVRMPEVVLVTATGDFPIDAVSGGIASIIDLAWQIYMYDNSGFPFTITIDEPENHLHPEMQKSILPNLINAFPNCQFIVSTHSPFIIGSIPNSNAYALRYNQDKKVFSTLLDTIDKTGTANEILREVLGLDDTMPNWVEDKIEAIIDKYKEFGITKSNVATFKQELTDSGLGKYIPSSLIKLVEEYKNDKAN